MKIILRLLKFARGNLHLLVWALIFVVFQTAAGIAIPRILGDGIDTVISSGQRSMVVLAAVGIILISIMRGVAGYYQRYFNELVSQRASYRVRNALYEKLQRLSFSFHDKSQTGQLMSRATVDVEAVRMFFSMGIVGMAQVVIMITGVAIVMFTMNTTLALITLALVLPVGWLGWMFGRKARPIWRKVQEIIGLMGNTLEESLAGISVVKAFSHEEHDSRTFKQQAANLFDYWMKTARLEARIMPAMVFLISVPTAVILWYGGNQAMQGTMTVGQITQFIMYVGLLMMPVRRLGMIINLYSRTISAGGRILEILDTESDVKEKPGAVELGRVRGHVVFENVSFSYGKRGTALKNISFEVLPGQTVALLGRSGSGKSTIANLLARFYDVTEGRILIDGVDIRDVTLASLRKNVVAAQQDVFLFSATVRENIAYGAVNATMDQIIEVARAAYLHDAIDALPAKYDTWVGERGDTLSGGEKQRLAIARTLLVNPSILILDDSTASVDASTERLIRQALDKLIKGRTTFIITHRIPIIKNADLILMLQDGEIIERGTHEELIRLGGLYREVYEEQLLIDQETQEIPEER